ncbi:MAG TPA: hypothetical protein ENJ45_06210, partial [Phaeodactylibacter sp.]|nr:hypothetical protein [Phaeodactylibacter sp.]
NPTPAASNNNTTGSLSYNAIFDIPVITGSDDAEEPLNQPYTIIAENTLNIVNDWSGDQKVGIRFQNIPFPPNTTIHTAYIQFTSAFPTASVGVADLNIHIENTPHSNTFSTADADISNRTWSTQSISWQPEEWNLLNGATQRERTPNLAPLLQEVLNLSAWQEGNAISFFFTGTGKRIAWSGDNPNSNFVPRLHIEGELPAPTELVQNLFINEIAASGTTYADEAQECDDWIELYNAGTEAVSIGGLFLTDDLDNRSKWQIASPTIIPPNGYQTIWIDKDPEQGGLHANFKLKGSGDQIALVQWVNGQFITLDAVDFEEIPFQSSYGRTTDGADTWTTFGQITPNAANDNALPWLTPPSIDLSTGAYSSPQNVTITHPNPNATIYYTTDGSEPDENSTQYTGALSISENTALKAKAFANGFMQSKSATASYLINEDLELPALFINTDPDNFFSAETGIYVEGTNGIPGFCVSFPANWNQDWEVPVHLSMINENGEMAFEVNAGAKIGGGCSRLFQVKSLNIATRGSKYGDDKIDYPIFQGRNHSKYQRIKLRNSGQDYLRMLCRDGILHTLLWDKVDLELQAYQPSVLYINGDFWGIHNIRELYTDEYFDAIYGIDKDEIDIVKNPGLDWEEVKQGDNNDYNALFSFFENNDFSNDDIFAQAAEKIDLNEFTNYWISMIYTANADWPANNIIVWKEKKTGAKWRYAVIDMDNSTNNGYSDQSIASYNTLAAATDDNSLNWPNHKNSTITLRKLLDNESFSDEFIQRTCSFIHLIYNPERVNHITDSIQTLIDPYVAQHIQMWNADNAGGGSYNNWLGWMDEFRSFFDDRPEHMRNFLQSKFNLNGTFNLHLNYNENSGGTLRINSNQMQTPYNYTGIYFKDIPIELFAIPNPGYEFVHWEETGETNPTIYFSSSSDATLTPIFQSVLNVYIGNDTSLCPGNTLLLDANVLGCDDCNYLWSTGDTGASIEITFENDITYFVTVTDNNGTTAVDELTITTSPSPIVTYEASTVQCPNDADGSISLQVSGGSGGYSFLWNTGADMQNISGLPPGTYSVTVSDQTGCETSVENIIVEGPPPYEIEVDTQSPSCIGDSDGSINVQVTGATPPYNYSWSNGGISQNISNIPAGTYGLIVTDAIGCSMVTAVTLDEADSLGVTTSIDLPEPGQSDGSILLSPFGGTAPYEVVWFNGETGMLLSNLTYGIYSYTLSDANGCTYEGTIHFFPTGTDMPRSLLNFALSPNPADDFFQISIALDRFQNFELFLFNSLGQMVKDERYAAMQCNIDIDVSAFAKGVYWVALKLENGEWGYKRLVLR